MTEKELERHLAKAVKDRGGVCYKFSSPGHVGVPDRIVALPNGKTGFVEVKNPEGGELSPIQVYELKRLTRLGHKSFVLNKPEMINQILDAIEK